MIRTFPFALIVAAGLSLAACQAESKAPAAPAGDPPAVAAPEKFCPVSGEKLGGMGAPVSYTHEGRTIEFCCAGCIEDFKKEPAKYLAKLDAKK